MNNNQILSKQAINSLLHDIKHFDPCDEFESVLDAIEYRERDRQLEQRAIEATVHNYQLSY